MKQKMRAKNVKGKKRRKVLPLKVTKEKYMELEDEDYLIKYDKDMDLMFHKFKEFRRHGKQTTKF